MILAVKVIPGACENTIMRFKDNQLTIRIRALPDKGKANEALIAFLAKTFKLPKSHFTIIAGQKSRLKKLEIKGLSEKDIVDFLAQSPLKLSS